MAKNSLDARILDVLKARDLFSVAHGRYQHAGVHISPKSGEACRADGSKLNRKEKKQFIEEHSPWQNCGN